MEEIGKTEETNKALLQLVSFNIGDEEFGVNILLVQEIIRVINITHIPNSPFYVDGVINLRGKIIPIIDLRTRIGIARKEHDKSTRIVVVDHNGRTAGFVVDSVSEVLRIPANLTEEPPDLIRGIENKFLTSVVRLEDRIMMLLDLDEVLAL